MTSSILTVLSAAAAGGGEQPPQWLTFAPFIAMAAIFWLLIWRPQARAQKQQRDKIAAIKKGDQVLTAGGFVGKVVKVDNDYAEIELGPNMKVKAVKSTITDVILPPGATPAND